MFKVTTKDTRATILSNVSIADFEQYCLYFLLDKT